jgi:Domain of unknown function (DUF397)
MTRTRPDTIPPGEKQMTDKQARWVKSSFSFANGDCIEVARLEDGKIGVRDSKASGSPVLRFTIAEWGAFINGVKHGEFDRFAI